MTSWLTAVDRRALAAFRARLAGAWSSESAEVGEHVRLVELCGDVGAREILATGLARLVVPVEQRFDPRRASELPKVPEGVEGVVVVALRRFARFHAERLRACLPEAPAAAERVLVVAVSDDEGFAGVVDTAEARLFPPGLDAESEDDPSRAGAKLREAFALLDACGYRPPRGGLWVDLGAFPGGMTRALLDRGAAVLAVDRNAPNAFLAEHPQVTYWRGDAEAFDAPELAAGAVGLVCDVNGSPGVAARAAARFARFLPPGALVVHTVKLPAWDDLDALLAAARATFAESGVDEIRFRHLPANRQEVAWLGVRRPNR